MQDSPTGLTGISPVAESPPSPVGRTALFLFALLVAVVGGLMGIPAAIAAEFTGGGLFVAFIGAPIIEEALKPTGVYLLLLRWPRALLGPIHIALLAAIGALCFALAESLVYVELYFPEGGSDYVLFRFTIPVAMHVIASFIVGLGLNRSLIEWAAGRVPFAKPTRNFYVTGVAIHAVYNIIATILSLTDVLEFDNLP